MSKVSFAPSEFPLSQPSSCQSDTTSFKTDSDMRESSQKVTKEIVEVKEESVKTDSVTSSSSSDESSCGEKSEGERQAELQEKMRSHILKQSTQLIPDEYKDYFGH